MASLALACKRRTWIRTANYVTFLEMEKTRKYGNTKTLHQKDRTVSRWDMYFSSLQKVVPAHEVMWVEVAVNRRTSWDASINIFTSLSSKVNGCPTLWPIWIDLERVQNIHPFTRSQVLILSNTYFKSKQLRRELNPKLWISTYINQIFGTFSVSHIARNEILWPCKTSVFKLCRSITVWRIDGKQ